MLLLLSAEGLFCKPGCNVPGIGLLATLFGWPGVEGSILIDNASPP